MSESKSSMPAITSSPLIWEVQFLVSNLNKKNFRSSLTELTELIKRYGDEVMVALISFLLQEIDFLDPKFRDSPKATLLSEAIGRSLRQCNFVTIIQASFESVTNLPIPSAAASSTDRRRPQPIVISDEFLNELSRVAKLSLSQSCAVAFSLTKLTDSNFASEATKFFTSRLIQVQNAVTGQSQSFNLNSSDPKSSIEQILTVDVHSIFATLISSYPIPQTQPLQNHSFSLLASGFSSRETRALLSLTESSSLNFRLSDYTLPNTDQTSNTDKPQVNDAGSRLSRFHEIQLKDSMLRVDSILESNISVDGVLIEFGAQCTETPESFASTLQQCSTCPIDEDQIAGILSSIIAGNAEDALGDRQAIYSLMQQPAVASEGKVEVDGKQQNWNREVIGRVLARDYAHLNWSLIAQLLDRPGFYISSQAHFIALLSIYQGCCKRLLPASAVIGRIWKNVRGQLSLLSYILNYATDVLDMETDSKSPLQMLDGVDVGNKAWQTESLYEVLVMLANQLPVADVRAVCGTAIKNYSDAVLFGFARIGNSRPIIPGVTAIRGSNCLRDDIIRQLLNDYLPPNPKNNFIQILSKLVNINSSIAIQFVIHALHVCNQANYATYIDQIISSQPSGNFRQELLTVCQDPQALFCLTCLSEGIDSAERRALEHVLHNVGQVGIIEMLDWAKNELAGLDRLRARKATEGHILSIDSLAFLLATLKANATDKVVEAIDVVINACNTKYEMHLGKSGTVETRANDKFQKIFSGQMSVEDAIDMLSQLKQSVNSQDQEVFRCIVHNLFDEYKFFHKFPERELQITARLFGSLVRHQLVSSITLGIALRYVLEAIRKNPSSDNPHNEKMFHFGTTALRQFCERLKEWPQYCSHVIQVPHLKTCEPQLCSVVEEAMRKGNGGVGNAIVPPTGAAGSELSSMFDSVAQPVASVPLANPPRTTQALPVTNSTVTTNTASPSKPLQPASHTATTTAVMTLSTVPSTPPKAQPLSVSNQVPQQQWFEVVDALNVRTLTLFALSQSESSDFDLAQLYPMPSEGIKRQIDFVLNSVTELNVEEKALTLVELVSVLHIDWFCHVIVNRVKSQQPMIDAYHGLTLCLSRYLPEIHGALLDATYLHALKLLQFGNMISNTNDRTFLKRIGSWLGRLTLSRNKIVLTRCLDMKELILRSFETGRIMAVSGFVGKVMECGKESRVFKPPNPWIMTILGIMKEIFEIESIKMNIKFEVESLFRSFNVKVDEVPKTDYLSRRRHPPRANNPDIVNATALAAGSDEKVGRLTPSPALKPVAATNQPLPQTLTALPPPANSEHSSNATAALRNEQTVIPNLETMIIVNDSIEIFKSNPYLKRLVPLAMDKAIRDIIQPIVTHSVAIASMTTLEIVLKDFVHDTEEAKIRRSAQQMVTNLAGSLALVTCREMLRAAAQNFLLTSLTAATNSTMARSDLETVTSLCVSDNLDIGCMVIRKAATEKAVHNVDESIGAALQSRRHPRYSAQSETYSSPQIVQFVEGLPEYLRPTNIGSRVSIYDDFSSSKSTVSSSSSSSSKQSGTPSTSTDQPEKPIVVVSGVQSIQAGQLLSVTQAVDLFHACVASIEVSVQHAIDGANGSQLTMSSMDSNQPIFGQLREVTMIVQKIQASARNDCMKKFAEEAIGKLYDGRTLHMLRLEVMIAVLESLRAANPSSFHDSIMMELVQMLSSHAAAMTSERDHNHHLAVLVMLVRAKLLTCAELDSYLAQSVDRNLASDSGNSSLPWVDLVVAVIKNNVIEGNGTIQEFAKTLSALDKIKFPSVEMQRNIANVITELIAHSKNAAARRSDNPVQGQSRSASSSSSSSREGDLVAKEQFRAQVVTLFDQWLQICQSSNDSTAHSQYLQLLQQRGVLRTEESADSFFRISTEVCVESCLKSAHAQPQLESGSKSSVAKTQTRPQLNYVVIDALSKLFVSLMRITDRDLSDTTSLRTNLLNRILMAIARTVLQFESSSKTASSVASDSSAFDQRPFFRLIINLMVDIRVPLNISDPKHETVLQQQLHSFTQMLYLLRPSIVPSFSFAWLELISHRNFLPLVLQTRNQKGWPLLQKLLMCLLTFLHPFLRGLFFSDEIKLLYRGTLRTFLILLHDFPEFLCDYHLNFCDVIPPNCIQLRNLILSAFPQSMRLPDPFVLSLNIESIPEIIQSPRIIPDCSAFLVEKKLKTAIDGYLSRLEPLELPKLLLVEIVSTVAGDTPNQLVFDLPLLSSIVIYVGRSHISQVQESVTGGTLSYNPNSRAFDIFRYLLIGMTPEGRYHLLNAIANQLRYPNNQTYYFSRLLLLLFEEAGARSARVGGEDQTDEDSYIQEQITRVLLERLIVHKPHPWGLLITFIELIKEARYGFWNKKFTRCTPDIQRVFESISKSCMVTAK